MGMSRRCDDIAPQEPVDELHDCLDESVLRMDLEYQYSEDQAKLPDDGVAKSVKSFDFATYAGATADSVDMEDCLHNSILVGIALTVAAAVGVVSGSVTERDKSVVIKMKLVPLALSARVVTGQQAYIVFAVQISHFRSETMKVCVNLKAAQNGPGDY